MSGPFVATDSWSGMPRSSRPGSASGAQDPFDQDDLPTPRGATRALLPVSRLAQGQGGGGHT
ncbi:hypothetical protein, partial [Streptomyces sp. NPDC002346]